MPIRDLLLFMVSHPRPTPSWALQHSSRLADQLDAQLSAALCQKNLPRVGNWLADQLVHANEIIVAENAKSRQGAHDLLAEFAESVGEAVRGESILIECGPAGMPSELARRARLHDLTIIPIEPDLEYEVVAEGLIFDSGRPVLLLPELRNPASGIEKLVVGWDGGRSATRALAESMPIQHVARSVEVALVTGEKKTDAGRYSDDLLRHLERHGIDADVVEVPAEGRDAGTALMDHSVGAGADLLVMGAYGHSRTREFVLGGATRSVLGNPRLPVLLAH